MSISSSQGCLPLPVRIVRLAPILDSKFTSVTKKISLNKLNNGKVLNELWDNQIVPQKVVETRTELKVEHVVFTLRFIRNTQYNWKWMVAHMPTIKIYCNKNNQITVLINLFNYFCGGSVFLQSDLCYVVLQAGSNYMKQLKNSPPLDLPMNKPMPLVQWLLSEERGQYKVYKCVSECGSSARQSAVWKRRGSQVLSCRLRCDVTGSSGLPTSTWQHFELRSLSGGDLRCVVLRAETEDWRRFGGLLGEFIAAVGSYHQVGRVDRECGLSVRCGPLRCVR